TVYTVRMGDEEENGIGTVTAGSPSTLSRDQILSSSNSNNAVNWGPGIKDVTLAPVAEMFDALQSAIDSLESDLGDAESAIPALETLTSAITKDGNNQYTIDPGANNRTALSVRNATGSPGANVLAFQITSAGVGKIEVKNAAGATKVCLIGFEEGRIFVEGDEDTGNPIGATQGSSEIEIVANTLTNVAHGLAAAPRKVWGVWRCKTADIGYEVGDEVPIQFSTEDTGNNQRDLRFGGTVGANG